MKEFENVKVTITKQPDGLYRSVSELIDNRINIYSYGHTIKACKENMIENVIAYPDISINSFKFRVKECKLLGILKSIADICKKVITKN